MPRTFKNWSYDVHRAFSSYVILDAILLFTCIHCIYFVLSQVILLPSITCFHRWFYWFYVLSCIHYVILLFLPAIIFRTSDLLQPMLLQPMLLQPMLLQPMLGRFTFLLIILLEDATTIWRILSTTAFLPLVQTRWASLSLLFQMRRKNAFRSQQSITTINRYTLHIDQL